MEVRASGQCSKRGKNWKSKSKVKHESEETSCTIKTRELNGSGFESTPVNPTSQREEMNERLKIHTLYVNHDINLQELLSQSFPQSIDESGTASGVEMESGFGLIGLHTCGSLGVDSLRLFLTNDESKFICNVPCCYHHL